MAKCCVCGKCVSFGMKIVYSRGHYNPTRGRTFKPNIKRVKALVKGTPKHINVCTSCLRSDRVVRV